MTRRGVGSLVLVLAAIVSSARGDVFLLKSGGRVSGQLLNADETPRKRYQIKTELGELTLAREQVERHVRQRPAEVEFDRIRHDYPDTPEGQWTLAEWCRQNTLLDVRNKTLERVLELDPDHAKARAALGYSKFEGQWKTQEQIQTERGYVYHNGRWVLPQEVENEKREQASKQARQEWFQKVNRWCDWLQGARAEEARRQLQAIRDPAAVDAVKYQLDNEKLDTRRLLYIEVLATIGNDTAWQVLALRAVEDPSEEVRHTCLDYLDDAPRPAAVKLYADRLRHQDATMINRAGVALRRLKEPSVVPALIDALQTKHRVLVNPGTSPGATSASFSPQVGGGFSAGAAKPQYVEFQSQNQDVLDALVALTGVSFNFDQAAWKQWYASQNRGRAIDVRRN